MSYYITIRSFKLDPRYIESPQIDLGDGIDMNDPRNPIKSELSLFNPEREMAGTKELKTWTPISKDDITDTFTFKEHSTVQEESNTLRQYFKVSYGLASINQSLEIAKREQKENHIIYALLEHSGEVQDLKSKDIDWGEVNPELDMTDNAENDLNRFLARYGSHYVSAIKYGLRIGIQAKLQKSKTTDSTDLSVDFKAAFDGASVGAGVSDEYSKKLENMGVEIIFEATSGGRTDGGLVTARNFEKINELLDGIGAGNIKFAVAPIQVFLNPYWPTLNPEWKNTRRVLEPHDEKLPLANYGVPKGTIIPWYPPPEYLQGLEDESKEVTISPPEGWAICNGIGGTPDLTERFIRGTTDAISIKVTGGEPEHNHIGSTGRPMLLPKEGENAVLHGHARIGGSSHQHKINTESNLPPYLYLVYIMKL